MRTSCHIVLAAAALVGLLVGCSDDPGGDAGGSSPVSGSEVTALGTDSSAVTDGSGATTEVGASTTSTIIDGAATTTTMAGVVASTTPPPEESDPFATAPEPEPTEPDDMPGPPADDCIDAAAGPASVELVFDDDRVTFAGATAPSCVRIHAGQQLVLRSASAAASTVVVGPDVYEIAAGVSTATAALGTLYAVGEVFDVYVEHLDISVVVQVLP